MKISVEQGIAQAKSSFKRGDFGAAKELYQNILQTFPHNKRAKRGLAEVLRNQRKLPHSSIKTELDRLGQMYNQGNFSAVVNTANSINKRSPKEVSVWEILGAAHRGLGNIKEASAAFKTVVELNPYYAEGYNNLGVALQDQGKYEESIECFTKALSIKSNYAEAHNNLGNVLEEMGRLEEAVSSYRNAILFRSNFAEAHNNLGVTFEKLGQLDDAKASYKNAIELNPDYAEAYNNLGNVLEEMGRYEDAEAKYRQALALKHNFFEAHNNLGNILRFSKKYKEAIHHFDLLNNDFGTALSLECLYINKNYVEFENRLNTLSLSENMNLRVAALSSFAAHQMKKKDPYPFCKNPIDFVSIQNISDYDFDTENVIHKIIKETDKFNLKWEARTTKFGFQGPSDIFENPSKIILVLEKIIHKAIETYYNNFRSESNIFIKSWPKKYKLSGWYNKLVKNGHHTSHIHQTGWLSGVIYLKTINLPNSDEGAIEFGLHGYDLPIIDKNYPRKIHRPKRGDIVLFPSSLFHRTIPFTMDSERSTIAFDLKAV